MKKTIICQFCKGRLTDFWSNPSFSKCTSCKLIIANPFPDQEGLNTLYKTAWTDASQNTSETGNMDRDLAHKYIFELFRQPEVAKIERDLKENGAILDFGAGRGALMRELKEFGRWDVYGVEPYGWEELVSEGLQVCPDLEGISKDILFHGIITMDVVEHLRAPWEAFCNLRKRLKPGGWLCVSTPNPNSLNARIRGEKWREAQKPGHILFMSDTTLIKMLQKCGFSNVRPMKWRVRFGDSIFRNAVQKLLQNFGLGGATRVIAFRPRDVHKN